MSTKPKLAIIGSGISGLSSAYFLTSNFDITVFEKSHRIGGHTSTVNLTESNGRQLSIDTGFMVFNQKTYPNLLKLFQKLQVDYQPTCMSFSFNQVDANLQWSGLSLNSLFAQRQNIFKASFHKLIFEIMRFNTSAGKLIFKQPKLGELTVEAFAKAQGYSTDFLNYYLIPLTGAIWSTQPHKMGQFPIKTLVQFLTNHGMLGFNQHLPWYTVKGGSQAYVKKILKTLERPIETNTQPIAITPLTEGNQAKVKIQFTNRPEAYFDKVIIATHADQALKLLAQPSPLEKELLPAFAYENNPTILHNNPSIMPKEKRAWASWNYRTETYQNQLMNSTHYYMSKLQDLPSKNYYFVSLNSDYLLQNDETTCYFKEDYTHPIFSREAVKNQQRLQQLNQQGAQHPLYFCGSYFGYGFHEDGLKSGIEVCKVLLNTTSIWD